MLKITIAESHNWQLDFTDIDYAAIQNNKGA